MPTSIPCTIVSPLCLGPSTPSCPPCCPNWPPSTNILFNYSMMSLRNSLSIPLLITINYSTSMHTINYRSSHLSLNNYSSSNNHNIGYTCMMNNNTKNNSNITNIFIITNTMIYDISNIKYI